MDDALVSGRHRAAALVRKSEARKCRAAAEARALAAYVASVLPKMRWLLEGGCDERPLHEAAMAFRRGDRQRAVGAVVGLERQYSSVEPCYRALFVAYLESVRLAAECLQQYG